MKTRKKYVYIINTLCLFVWLFTGIMGAGKMAMASSETQGVVSELPQGVRQMESGIVKLLVYAVDQEGKEYNVKQGTGILVGTEEGGKHVLANDTLVQVDEEQLNKVRRQFGLSMESDLDINIDIILQVGTRIKTEIGNSGEDFVLLNLVNDINNVSCLRLGSSISVKENNILYILGYGGNSEIWGQTGIGNLELQEKTVQVTAAAEDEIAIDYQLEGVNPGTPVMNADGYVVGILALGDNVLFIKPIDKVKNVLDVLSISYLGEETGSQYNEVTDEIRDKLNKALLECEALVMKEDAYTKKSVEHLKEVIKEAVSVTTNGEAGYDDYQSAIEQLDKYKDKLKKKDYPIRMIQAGIALIILIFIMLCFRTRLQIKKLKVENNRVSGVGTEENREIYAKLIRLDTMQEILISNVIFRIGQNMADMDYAVTDNTSISRHHADIMRKGNGFFILDNNSTNHTFVNDKQAMPGEYVPIKGGDILRLSDVYFRFEV